MGGIAITFIVGMIVTLLSSIFLVFCRDGGGGSLFFLVVTCIGVLVSGVTLSVLIANFLDAGIAFFLASI